jgi:excisionase family DNA binding protein
MGASTAGDGSNEVWVTAGVAARMLQVVPGTVRRYAEDGKIAHTRTLGGHVRFRLADLEVLQERLAHLEVADDVSSGLGEHPNAGRRPS